MIMIRPSKNSSRKQLNNMNQPRPPNTPLLDAIDDRVKEIVRQVLERADRLTETDKVHIEIDCAAETVRMKILNIYE
jgi:hypothetical protein